MPLQMIIIPDRNSSLKVMKNAGRASLCSFNPSKRKIREFQLNRETIPIQEKKKS